MNKCNFCNSLIEGFPYRCKYCGMLYCNDHRIPETHKCSFDLMIKKEEIFYQDALDFMAQKFTIAKIYEYVTTKQLEKSDAIRLLNFFIENSEEVEDRVNSLYAFELLTLDSDEAYKILENCLLSDEDFNIRKAAADVLIKMFPNKSKNVLKWALNHNDEKI